MSLKNSYFRLKVACTVYYTVKLISTPELQIGICPGLDSSLETKDCLKAFLSAYFHFSPNLCRVLSVLRFQQKYKMADKLFQDRCLFRELFLMYLDYTITVPCQYVLRAVSWFRQNNYEGRSETAQAKMLPQLLALSRRWAPKHQLF